MWKRKKYKQTGRSNNKKDKKLVAKPVGWRRVSSGPNKGKWYKETRANRSDKNKKKKL